MPFTSQDKVSFPPMIFIDSLAKQKLELYTHFAPGEISGLGKIEKVEDALVISDIYLFEQVASAAGTNLDIQKVSQFIYQWVKEDIDPEQLKLWWHSHGHLAAFWSGIDLGTIEAFKNSWMVSLVSSKSGDYRLRLDLYQPIRLTFDNLPLGIRERICPDIKEAIQEEVALKVKGWSSNISWSDEGYFGGYPYPSR